MINNMSCMSESWDYMVGTVLQAQNFRVVVETGIILGIYIQKPLDLDTWRAMLPPNGWLGK